jgi:hypothetical protein
MSPSDNENRGPGGAGQGRAEDDEYAIRVEPPSSPATDVPYVPNRDYRDPRLIAERAAEAEPVAESAWDEVRPAPPRGLFFSGTFTFPFRKHVLIPLLILLVGAIVVVATFELAVIFENDITAGKLETGEAVRTVGSQLATMVFTVLGVILTLVWTAVGSVYGLVILHDTADGGDAVEQWPTPYSLDALRGSVFVILALAIGILPALVTGPLWDWLAWPKLLLLTISALLLSPALVMSTLESGNLMSIPVWRSIRTAWQAWAIFYLITLPAGVVVYLLLRLLMERTGIAGAIPAAFLLAVPWLIYFRLLGRLAMFCSGRSAEAAS